MTPKATRVSLTKFEKGIAGRLTFLGSAQAYRCDTAHPSFLSKTVFSSARKYKFRCWISCSLFPRRNEGLGFFWKTTDKDQSVHKQ
jgi:hypothetical protein